MLQSARRRGKCCIVGKRRKWRSELFLGKFHSRIDDAPRWQNDSGAIQAFVPLIGMGGLQDERVNCGDSLWKRLLPFANINVE